ncbi:hypothetical protein QA601_02335 [Chitinispirillales bacterium ANBcel5]|uniref:hypothetical protein n=1 Tax=Cellulosispirillum alkaliphilum TaxID=3039283 RepID=UPI002A4FAE02|nr:hypothetical protein [Chitinispirillales bacterium ANBcel5]
METIFDHNVTEHELNKLFGESTNGNNYMFTPIDSNGHNKLLYHLFLLRNQPIMADIYLKKMNDSMRIFDYSHRDSIATISESEYYDCIKSAMKESTFI